MSSGYGELGLGFVFFYSFMEFFFIIFSCFSYCL